MTQIQTQGDTIQKEEVTVKIVKMIKAQEELQRKTFKKIPIQEDLMNKIEDHKVVLKDSQYLPKDNKTN